MNWSQLGMDIVDNTVAVVVSEMVGLQSKLSSPGDSEAMRYVKMGVLNAGLDNVISQLRHGHSDITDMNYYNVIDDVVFKTVGIAVLDKSGVGAQVGARIESIAPFSQDINGALVNGVIRVGLNTTQEFLDQNYAGSMFDNLVHPTLLIR